MSFRDMLVGVSSQARYVIETIGTSGCIVFQKRGDGRVGYTLDPSRIPRDLHGILEGFSGMGSCFILEAFISAMGVHDGPKVISLNHLDAEALEHTRLNLSLEDYNQPFPSVFVDLPQGFGQSHVVSCPQAGNTNYKDVVPDNHYPHCVGIYLHRDAYLCFLVVSIYYSSHQVFTSMIDPTLGDTLEDAIQSCFAPDNRPKDSLEMSDQEGLVSQAALRVAMNTVLILEGEGMKTLGPADPKHYQRLQENLKKARKRRDPPEKIQRAEQILRSEPVYYGFSQDVVLYTREDSGTHEPSESTGRHVRSHWRRGHYRMQNYGVGNSQRKRIRVPPVMVNKNQFLGHTRDTSVTYRDTRKVETPS